MKFPAMNKQNRRRVNVPEFTGGLNLRDNPTQCNDNQLTDSLNVWYQDGTLRTRPGMCSSERMITSIERATSFQKVEDARRFPEIQYEKTEGGVSRSYILEAIQKLEDNEEYTDDIYNSTIIFRWLGENDVINISSLCISGVKDFLKYFVVEKNSILYCFLSNRSIYKLEYTKDNAVWKPITEEEIYVPVIAINCMPYGGNSDSYLKASLSGDLIEGYNIIGEKYKLIYSTASNDKDSVFMRYIIPIDVHETTRYYGKTVSAKITTIDGNVYNHSVTITGYPLSTQTELAYDIEKEDSGDGLYMGVRGNRVTFFKSSNGGEPASVLKEDFVRNNMEIEAPCIFSESEKSRVFNMTQSEWFGGASAGLAGGTRLFLCGNADEKEKALVCWSGLNNPLYFPENSYYYVGNTSERVTGFGKQSDMLVIFKENETWFTQYYQNTDITAEDLINQSVVDMQANAVYFPLVQINPNIGCPYPDTVKLCRNRLVWLGSGGKVYTLVSSSQYNERNIFCVSEMIKKIGGSNPNACDWEGYYCLSCGGLLYLMDYNSYGYQYITSFSKTEDANVKIPWYLWELPMSGAVSTVGDSMILSGYLNAEAGQNCSLAAYYVNKSNIVYDNVLCEDSESGELKFSQEKIKSFAQTKFFDFGEPNSYKNICSVGLSLGFNGGDEITVTFLTDGGEEQTGLVLEGDADERTAGFTKSRILYPAIRSAVRFGIKLECEGNMIIDGLNIDYRVLGRAR